MSKKETETRAIVQVPVRDISKSALEKAATKSALTHWTFQYSGAFLAISLIFMAVLGLKEILFWASLGSFLSMGGSFTLRRYMWAEKFEKNYLSGMLEEIREETAEKEKHLIQELRKHNCKKGVAQFDQLKADFASLMELLETKLNPTELTFQRYQTIVEEVYLSGIDNLHKVLVFLMSISEIDTRTIKRRITSLQQKSPTSTVQQEIEQLEKRLAIRDEKLAKVDELLLENEEAITKLEETASLIAEMDTGLDQAKIDMESSIEELNDITEWARRHM